MPFCIADCQIVLFKIIVHIMNSFVGFFFSCACIFFRLFAIGKLVFLIIIITIIIVNKNSSSIEVKLKKNGSNFPCFCWSSKQN